MSALEESFNLLLESVKEWYSIHFPELERLCTDKEFYLELIKEIGLKENFSEKNIMNYKKDSKLALQIVEKAKNSIGSPIQDTDLQRIQKLAEYALKLKKERETLGVYIERIMEKELPNFTLLATPLIGAKLLAMAGSKRKLALMPASTIQLLGAEKALFRHLNTGNKPPKYGYLYQHPFVVKAKRESKGKIARTLSGKLSLALKADYFGGEANGKRLEKEMEARIKELG